MSKADRRLARQAKRAELELEALRGEIFDDPAPQISVGDPALAEFLGLSGIYGSQSTTEWQALGLTAIYRCQALIAGTIAGLPLKVYRTDPISGERERVEHWLSSSPAGPFDITPYNWVETVVLYLLNHGESYLKSIRTDGHELVGLYPTHPLAISRVKWSGFDKIFSVQMADGSVEQLATGEMVQTLGMTLDNLRGLSPLALFRQALTISRQGELAAARTFSDGALYGGLVTTAEDVDEIEAKEIKDRLKANSAGAQHAGDIAFVNRSLVFTPWTMSNRDAEFLASRAFQIDEACRIYGVPSHLVNATEKQTSWGAGIQEQDLALARYTLSSYTGRIESSINRSEILAPGLHCEFDYSGLLAGTPAQEIELLLAQIEGGLLTPDEARAIRNLPPTPGGDRLRVPSAPGTPTPLATGAASSPKD